MFCEVLSRTIDHIIRVCRRRHWRVPDQICLQSDNTTSWARNQTTMQFLASIVAHLMFTVALINFLVVGHTHEDIDRLFAFLIASVIRRKAFHCPEDLATDIVEGMAGYFSPHGEVCEAEMLTHVHDFDDWVAPLATRLTNAFVARDGVDVPHSFTFKLWRDLSQSEKAMTGRPSSTVDVYAVTKRWMRSTSPSGPPTLVLPDARKELLSRGGPTNAKPQKNVVCCESRANAQLGTILGDTH